MASVINGEVLVGSAPWPVTRAATTIKAQPVGGGMLLPTYWSRDGRWLAGPVIPASGVQRGNALYDVAAGKIRQLSDAAASEAMAWMPGNTRVIYFTIVFYTIRSRFRNR